MRRPSISRLWTFAKLILALILFWAFFVHVDLAQFFILHKYLSWFWLTLSLVLFFVMMMIKALQYYVFFEDELAYSQMLRVVVLQNLVSNFIASGAGIASLLASLKVEHEVKLRRSSLAFLLVKWGDFFALWCFLLFSIGWVETQDKVLRNVAVGLLFLVGLGWSSALAIVVWRKKLLLVVRFLRKKLTSEPHLLHRTFALLESVFSQNSLNEGVLGKIALVSLIYLFITMVWSYANLRAFSVELSMPVVIFVNIFIQILSNLPVHIFGNLGTMEITSLYLYRLFYPEQAKLVVALLGIRLWFYLNNFLTLLYFPFNSILAKIRNVHD